MQQRAWPRRCLTLLKSPTLRTLRVSFVDFLSVSRLFALFLFLRCLELGNVRWSSRRWILLWRNSELLASKSMEYIIYMIYVFFVANFYLYNFWGFCGSQLLMLFPGRQLDVWGFGRRSAWGWSSTCFGRLERLVKRAVELAVVQKKTPTGTTVLVLSLFLAPFFDPQPAVENAARNGVAAPLSLQAHLRVSSRVYQLCKLEPETIWRLNMILQMCIWNQSLKHQGTTKLALPQSQLT